LGLAKLPKKPSSDAYCFPNCLPFKFRVGVYFDMEKLYGLFAYQENSNNHAQ